MARQPDPQRRPAEELVKERTTVLPLEEMQRRRVDFLKRLWELSDGHSSNRVPYRDIQAELGLDDSESEKVMTYLRDEGLLEFVTSGNISITHQGILEVEASLSDRNPTIGKTNLPDNERPDARTSTEVNDRSVVAVVHGRNEKARKAMFDFLRALGLKPLEFTQAIHLTGKASPYVGEVLDVLFGKSQAVVVILSGDEEVRLREKLRDPNTTAGADVGFQSRPNVFFEAGLAMGRHPERTILVQIGPHRPFSDVAGRHICHFQGTDKERNDLASRLERALCPVDKTGSDWLTAGNFGEVLEAVGDQSEAPSEKPRLSPDELTLLVAAAQGGDISVLSTDQLGRWIRVGNHDFVDQQYPEVAATYLAALTSLCEGGLVQHQGGVLYSLTSHGRAAVDLMQNTQHSR